MSVTHDFLPVTRRETTAVMRIFIVGVTINHHRKAIVPLWIIVTLRAVICVMENHQVIPRDQSLNMLVNKKSQNEKMLKPCASNHGNLRLSLIGSRSIRFITTSVNDHFGAIS